MTVVVGAAIVRHGRVLAARRRRPPETAGGWELPGGKVDPGEEPAGAVRREVTEELGCEVRVEGWLDGEEPIRAGLVLRVAHCTLVDGEPVAGVDHDELRWLGPDELEEVAWLAPDRPFLPAVRALLLGS